MNCDIIIPVWNQMQLTKECIDSIIRHTSSPYRLIVIDNGSQKQTKEYLEELTRNNNILITLIRNETNLGCIKAVNQGLNTSYADYVCLLNNDTRVEDGWLEELINVARNNPKIGIVTARSSKKYKNENEQKGSWMEIGFATGFCILIKREVIQKIGLLDEAYGIGFWEDTDYCQRAKNAGYFCALAKSAYVYHYAHKTFDFFEKNRLDDLFEKNRSLFISKWGKILRIACVIFERNIENKEINNILSLARKGHMIYLFLKSTAKLRTNIEHGNIRKFRYPDILFNFFISMKIWQRQKKNKTKFDKILTDNLKFASKVQLLNSDLEIEMI